MANNNNPMFSLADLSALNGGARVDLAEILKSQLQAMVGQPNDVLDFLSLSPNVKKRVEVLRKIQDDHDILEAQFQVERAYLEAKYQLLYQPLYTKRYEIVNGLAEVEGVAVETAAETSSKAGEKGVPSFWLIALKNNDVLAEEITERDEEALVFLKDIKYTKIVEPLGFKLEFFFDPNPYFSNTVLTKTYLMLDEEEPTMEKAIGTTIDWLPGKCLTEKNMNNKLKEAMNTDSITKTESDSFFNFFNPPEIPERGGEIDKEACDELVNEMEQDYDIGSTIRDEIIPHAVSWFTGEAADGESDDDDEDDDDEDMYDGLPDDDEEVGNNEAEKKIGDAPQGERAADCKQQ